MNLKVVNHQSGEVIFGEETSYTCCCHRTFPLKQWPPFNSRYLLFIHVCCFRFWEPSWQYSLFLPALGSVCPFILTPALSRFCVLNARQVLCIFSLSSIPLWMDRCKDHGPWRGRVENRICSLRMQRGKKVRERDGWEEGGLWGCIWCETPSKASRGIKAEHGQPDAASPCHPQGIHPSACFWQTPSSCCFFTQLFLWIVTCTTSETLNCEEYPL